MISEEDKRKRIRSFYRLGWFWVSIQVLCVMYVMSTLYTISEKGTPISYGFSAIWIAFMAVIIGVYGVQVLRETLMRTQYHIGILIGISGMIAITMFIELIFTAGDVAHAKIKGAEHQALTSTEMWSVTFALLCVVCYSLYSCQLYRFRAAMVLFHEDIYKKKIFSVSKNAKQFTKNPTPTEKLNKSLVFE